MYYLNILFNKWNTRITPAVVIDEEGANIVGKFIRGGITGGRRHNLFKIWKYLDIHGMPHKRSLVWKIC